VATGVGVMHNGCLQTAAGDAVLLPQPSLSCVIQSGRQVYTRRESHLFPRHAAGVHACYVYPAGVGCGKGGGMHHRKAVRLQHCEAPLTPKLRRFRRKLVPSRGNKASRAQ
jgi:hypothetical protein